MYLKTGSLELTKRYKGNAKDRSGVLWLQGEDTCGLAVIAVTLEHVLTRQGYNVTLLDQDQINNGLCKGLSDSTMDRLEYARRIAEAAKLFEENGSLTIVIVESLTHDEHTIVRDILNESIYSSAYIEFPEYSPLKIDKAHTITCLPVEPVRRFTVPKVPDIQLNASRLRTEDCINLLLAHLDQRGSLPRGYSPLATVTNAAKQQDISETPISIAAG